jgi:hypothetical protein
MIETNKYNSAWLGLNAGTLADPGWFLKSASERDTELAGFGFVEFKARMSEAPAATLLHESGFFWVDAIIGFRIGLSHLTSTPSLERYDCVSAQAETFHVDGNEMMDFQNERFLSLPGMTSELLAKRYESWANQLIQEDPSSCFRVLLGGKTQGWFLGKKRGTTVELTLAMLAKGASASGAHLYHKALLAYSNMGCSMGKAAFSVKNTPVLNIYSSMGAHFTQPEGVWMWVSK